MANSHKLVAQADAHAPAVHASTHNAGGSDAMTNPQFTTIELGAASDTTIARASAGNLTVEGNALYRAGGTDVAVADGGTGASTAGAGFNALSPMTTSGDTIYGGASGAGTRLAKGTDGQVLTLASGLPSWAASAGGTPARHGCLVYHNTTQTVNGAAVLFNSEIYDSDAYHDTGSNTDRITVPSGKDGLYLLEYGGNITSAATGEFCRISLNGGGNISPNEAQTDNGYFSGFCVYPLVATDYIRVIFTGNRTVGHASAYEAQFHFSATLLGT